MSELTGSDLSEGLRMLQMGQFSEAAGYFTDVVQRDPTNGPAFGFLGIALTRLGQTDGALEALGKASQLQPQTPGAQYNVAIGLMHAGRQQDAIPFLNYTLQLEPGHAQAQAALAGINTVQPPPPTQQTSPFGGPAASIDSGLAPLSGPVYPSPSPQGMHYTQTVRPQVVQIAPDLGTRLLRGLGWGAVYGQIWTGWNFFWDIVWGFGHLAVGGALFTLAVYFVVFTISGAIAGLIIAALPPSINSGIAVCVVFGLIFCGIEMWMSGKLEMGVNIFFWFITGRVIGANIAARVHRPIQQ